MSLLQSACNSFYCGDVINVVLFSSSPFVFGLYCFLFRDVTGNPLVCSPLFCSIHQPAISQPRVSHPSPYLIGTCNTNGSVINISTYYISGQCMLTNTGLLLTLSVHANIQHLCLSTSADCTH